MAAEPEGEGERRRADEAIVRRGLQHMLSVGIARRQHVAVKMHGAFRLAGGAGREGDQANVVDGGIERIEFFIARLAHQRFERVRPVAAPVHDSLETGS